MKHRLLLLFLLALIALLLAETAQAMQSPQYKLSWFTPLTIGSGRTVSSPNYIASFSLGQTVILTSASSTNYHARLGFWAELGEWVFHVFLPAIQR
jgi:hypothetical protein